MMLHYRRIDVACLLFLLQLSLSSCFQIHPRHPTERIFSNTAAVITDLSKADTAASGVSLNSKKVKNDDDDSWDEKEEVVFVPEEDFEILFGEEEQKKEENLDPVEKAWRYAKKPLLSVGAKGATFSHGNSLRQLLEAHTVVKVKVNTQKFGTLEKAFEDIRDLCVESGAPEGIEMLQARDKDKIILFGLPGTKERLKQGDFPPPPRNGSVEKDEEKAM